MPTRPDTIFFLSDYGTRDEFAGVVRAVLRALAPHAAVVDLTHEIPPFDVVAGAHTLERALPHLGPGVVLAVVDPGVGSPRRRLALRVEGGGGVRYFIGPDNGLFVGPAERLGGALEARQIQPARLLPATTFDGRDVFAPAAAHLCNGADFEALGPPLDLAALVRLRSSEPEEGVLSDGRPVRWCEVTWVDRFGNAQLSASPSDAEPDAYALVWPVGSERADGRVTAVRRVAAFDDLGPRELGLLSDANGRLALVVREGSAAALVGLRRGEVVGLAEPAP